MTWGAAWGCTGLQWGWVTWTAGDAALPSKVLPGGLEPACDESLHMLELERFEACKSVLHYRAVGPQREGGAAARSKGGFRELQRWQPEPGAGAGEHLEADALRKGGRGGGGGGGGGVHWDQFAVNQAKFKARALGARRPGAAAGGCRGAGAGLCGPQAPSRTRSVARAGAQRVPGQAANAARGPVALCCPAPRASESWAALRAQQRGPAAAAGRARERVAPVGLSRTQRRVHFA